MRRRPITPLRFLLLAAIVAALGVAAWYLQPRSPVRQVYADGTEAIMVPGSKLSPAAGFPQMRELRADGEFYLTVPAGTAPLTVRSRLLVLTVPGASVFRLTAHADEAGEQVEVVSGSITARKNYPSTESQPDELGPGDMSMVNRSIDLMEKEHFTVAEAQAWGEDLRRRARSAP